MSVRPIREHRTELLGVRRWHDDGHCQHEGQDGDSPNRVDAQTIAQSGCSAQPGIAYFEHGEV